MAVTSHVYPKAISAIEAGTINLSSHTFKVMLFTGSAATWGATQEAYQWVSDLKTAYTEVSSGGYARVTLSSLSITASGANVVWTCASPISFGSSITLSAASMAILDSSVGSGVDSATPVVCVADFGATVSSTASTWTYTVDGTNGLFVATSS